MKGVRNWEGSAKASGGLEEGRSAIGDSSGKWDERSVTRLHNGRSEVKSIYRKGGSLYCRLFSVSTNLQGKRQSKQISQSMKITRRAI